VARLGVPSLEGWVYKDLLRAPGPAFPALLVSRPALDGIGLLDEAIVTCQEWETAIRLAKYQLFGFVSRPTFIYDCRHTNAMSKTLLRSATGYDQVVRKHRWAILYRLGPRALCAHYDTARSLYEAAGAREKAEGCRLRADRWRRAANVAQ